MVTKKKLPTSTAGLSQQELLAQISSIDAEISAHQDMLRGAALTVYRPLLDQALDRIRRATAELLVPAGAIPETVKGLPVGLQVTVTMSPAEAAVVIGHRVNPETGAQEVILLVRGKGIVVAKPEEVTPGLPSSSAPPTLEVSVPGPLPQVVESAPVSSSSGSIHAGDMVQTPLGPGRVVVEPVEGGNLYRVEVIGQSAYQFPREQLKVVPPPAPTSP